MKEPLVGEGEAGGGGGLRTSGLGAPQKEKAPSLSMGKNSRLEKKPCAENSVPRSCEGCLGCWLKEWLGRVRVSEAAGRKAGGGVGIFHYFKMTLLPHILVSPGTLN